jgi:AraC family transcriptional regulator
MSRSAPITLGSPRSSSLSTPVARLTEVWFPPGAVLDLHRHERPILAIMLAGSMDTHIGARQLACMPSCAWTEPAGEEHVNHIESGGARVFVVEVAPDNGMVPGAVHARLLEDITLQHDPHLALDAYRALAEVRRRDELSAAVLDSLALLLLTRAARLIKKQRFHATMPAWLLGARDFLHAHFRDTVSLTALAHEVGVDAVTLTRQFRRAFGMTPGEYARARRVDWCLEQLVTTRESISSIAHRAGFADQSHLTRACTARVGMPPAAYRRAVGRD